MGKPTGLLKRRGGTQDPWVRVGCGAPLPIQATACDRQARLCIVGGSASCIEPIPHVCPIRPALPRISLGHIERKPPADVV